MSKRKMTVEPVEPVPQEPQERVFNLDPNPTEPVEKKNPWFTILPWKGGLEVYRCLQCSLDSVSKDDMALHIVSHAPEAERSLLLDQIMKEMV
jgi:hypothetical protein